MNAYLSRRLVAVGLILGGLAAAIAQAQDVHVYEIIRGEYFTQVTTNRASTEAAALHYLYGYVVPSYDGSVQSARLRSPKGWTQVMTNTGATFSLSKEPGETVDLAKSAPAGLYQFDVIGVTRGEEKKSLSLPGPATAIPPARIANLREAQAVDSAQDFIVQWEKVARRGAKDYLRFDIFDAAGDRVFNSGNLTLDQTANLIPAGTLQPNSTNTGYLHIWHYFKLSKDVQPPYWYTTEDRITRFLIKTLNPAGVFRLSPLCVTAAENQGTATMTVQRTQGCEGEVTVDYFSTEISNSWRTVQLPDGSGAGHQVPISLWSQGAARATHRSRPFYRARRIL